MRVFALDELDKKNFLKYLNFKTKVVYELGATTGLRISDIVRLKKEVLNIKEPTITEKKTGKSKRFYIKSEIRKALSEIAKDSQNEFIFYSATAKSGHISRQSVWKAFKHAQKCACLNTNIGTQSMRKAYAKKIKKTHNYKYLQTKLNHDNVLTSMLYCMDKGDFENE